MDAKESLVILVFPAVKVLLGQTVFKESLDQKAMLVPMDKKETRVILEVTVNQGVLETMAHWEHRENVDHPEQMVTKANVVMMGHLDKMAFVEREVKLERKGSKVLVETEAQEERRVNQDPVESKEGRVQLDLTETLVSLENRVLLATEATRDPRDQRDPKAREESKELRETEASLESEEKMEPSEMVLWVVTVFRVILASVEKMGSLAVREPQDPKETMESPEIQAQITVSLGLPGLRGPKATEDLRAERDLLGLVDLQDLMNVKFWTSS